MALTVIFALIGSMIMSLTLMPVLASLFLPRRIEEEEPWIMRAIKSVYVPVLHLAMRNKAFVVGFAVSVAFVAFAIVAPNLGSEFVPRLSEGAMAISVVRLTGTTMEDSIEYNTQMERTLLATFPDEIEHVWSRIGTAEIATDPMGIELTDMFVTLKPRDQWTKAHTQAELTTLVEAQLRDLPGQRLEFLQPIEMRMNEMVSGVRADLAVKLYGDDLDVLAAKGKEIEAILEQIPGAADVASEQITGQPVLQIKLNQEQLARYGVPAKVVTDIIESIGSKPLGEVIEGQLRFPLVVRLPEEMRSGTRGIGSITVPTATGERLPLSRLADIRVIEGPATITREGGQRRINVAANVRGRDIGSFVAEAQAKMKEQFKQPPGRYFYEFGGQFEHLQRARTRLLIVVPAALLLIFALLYITYQNWIDVLRVFTGVPFGWIGGIFALWLRDMPFSISAAIGFIALSGVAVLDDMILVSYIRQLRAKACPWRKPSKTRPPRAAPRADDHAGRQPRLLADGVQHRHGRRSPTPTGHGRHRRRDQRHDHVAVGPARALHPVRRPSEALHGTSGHRRSGIAYGQHCLIFSPKGSHDDYQESAVGSRSRHLRIGVRRLQQTLRSTGHRRRRHPGFRHAQPRRMVVQRARRAGGSLRPVPPQNRRRFQGQRRLVRNTRPPRLAMLRLPPGISGKVCRSLRSQVRQTAPQTRIS